MIRLPDIPLPDDMHQKLNQLQSEIDQIPDYATRVSAAKEKFESQNRPINSTFRVIRESLTRMCSGARRCCYCEDSMADEIEHIKPKTLYPEETFVWLNYIYAYGPCNGPKKDRYAVFSFASNAFVDVTRKRGDPVLPPEPGDPVLINPRIEDPLDFLWLDLKDTFFFLPFHASPSKEYDRAKYTIDVLKFNDRDDLRRARNEAYDSYRARLREYVTERDAECAMVRLAALKSSLRNMGHPTVWREMKRQHERLSELRPLFEQASEALDW